MDQSTLDIMRAAEEAVRRLVEACCRGGQLYQRAPRAVAQVSRTGKWHLNAIAQTRRALAASEDAQTSNSKRGT